MQRAGTSRPSADQRLALLSKIDILAGLSEAEMDYIVEAAGPYLRRRGTALQPAPPKPIEALFLLKRDRVRVFRVSAEGRALTTAILEAGTPCWGDGAAWPADARQLRRAAGARWSPQLADDRLQLHARQPSVAAPPQVMRRDGRC